MAEYCFPKLTGTHAEVFAAAGLADLLRSVGNCLIRDAGAEFRVQLEPDPVASSWDDIDLSPGYCYLRPNEKSAVPDGLPKAAVVDYPAEKEKADRYRQAKQRARETGTQLGSEIAADAPRPDWRLYQALNALQGDDATNKVAVAIWSENPEKLRALIRGAVESLGQRQKPVTGWPPVTLVQLFNPHAAKGYARLKADSTDRNDGTKNYWGEAFVEWLKYRGYFRLACPFFLGSKGEHVRLLCPIPRRISFRLLQVVADKLRHMALGRSAPKLDCLAVLGLAEILIRRSPEFQEPAAPQELVSDVSIVQYQSMGQSKAVTSVERLALPDWFPIQSQAEADLWLEILAEHRTVVRSLQDDRSDEIGLLLSYRRYLQKRGRKSVAALIGFLESYGAFLLGARERGRKLKQFRTDHVEAILMAEPDLSAIVRNDGFRAVAAAIRSATVSAQSLKRMGKDYRDIRYDLLPDLRRKRSLPGTGPFLEALSEFVARFNAESAKRLEQGKRSGIRRVSAEEWQAFLGLFSGAKDAALIGALLCAYATCRSPQEAESKDEAAAEEAVALEEQDA